MFVSSNLSGKLSTSKGNQVKMSVDNVWYKVDYFGYEGAAEYVCSVLLSQTNIKNYVDYDICEIEANGRKFIGCKSKSFLKSNEEIITMGKLFKQNFNKSVPTFIEKGSLPERIKRFVDAVVEVTGLEDYGQELTKTLEWDRLVLNEDRHFNNLAVLYNHDSREYSSCLIFDNGAAFLSDTRVSYPLEKNTYDLIAEVKAKPFDEDFDKQVEACEYLYGKQLKLDKDICIPEEVLKKVELTYGKKVSNRIATVFEHQELG